MTTYFERLYVIYIGLYKFPCSSRGVPFSFLYRAVGIFNYVEPGNLRTKYHVLVEMIKKKRY